MCQLPETVRSYSSEIIYRIREIQTKCDYLDSLDFPSASPKRLLRLIKNTSAILEDAVCAVFIDFSRNEEDGDEEFTTLILIDDFAEEIYSHLRYVDGAITTKLPWSIINSFETLIKQIMPNAEVMLRPQWKYNFSIVISDFRAMYQRYLNKLSQYVPQEKINGVFDDFPDSFYVASFPALERKNILIHCLLGHEVGHLRAKQYIKHATSECLKAIEQQVKGLGIRDSYEQAEKIKTASLAWQRGLEEILSDIVGVLLFGPAILFSTHEFALGYDYNCTPSNENYYYPPWKMRLSEIYKVITEIPDTKSASHFLPLSHNAAFLPEIITAINKKSEEIKNTLRERLDKAKIDNDPILKIAYKQIEKDITIATKEFRQEFAGKSLIMGPEKLYAKLQELIDRLKTGIPPNASEQPNSERTPATTVEIINAAWFHKIQYQGKDLDASAKSTPNGVAKEFNNRHIKKDTTNRLVLKAIEYSHIETEHHQFMLSQVNPKTPCPR